MTRKVILDNLGITMHGTSTITQKGQVAIPKEIRDFFNLKASDKLHFSVENNKIVAEPVISVKEMRGFIKTKKVLSKKEMKKIIRDAVLEKYANRS
ncbi:MAG: AbrB/MazE/SpoVT family DNA-binding domain-containing protein [Candidatus Levybacteria bacterium]|nr:AbrB/MazE/SpoVT family DNA-binding domain-containing protein [Candidatus Levybacteria bacterium]